MMIKTTRLKGVKCVADCKFITAKKSRSGNNWLHIYSPVVFGVPVFFHHRTIISLHELFEENSIQEWYRTIHNRVVVDLYFNLYAPGNLPDSQFNDINTTSPYPPSLVLPLSYFLMILISTLLFNVLSASVYSSSTSLLVPAYPLYDILSFSMPFSARY